MDTPVTAVVIVVAGAIIAVAGVMSTVRTSRRAISDADAGARSDLAVAVAVFGVVAMLFGFAYLGYLLLLRA